MRLFSAPAIRQMKALAPLDAVSSNARVTAVPRTLNRRVLSPGVEDPVRVEGLFEPAVKPFTNHVERVKGRNSFVAMPKQYGMPSGFCDLVPNRVRRHVAADPALCAAPVGEHAVFTFESRRCGGKR
jgi:hypothetical protein